MKAAAEKDQRYKKINISERISSGKEVVVAFPCLAAHEQLTRSICSKDLAAHEQPACSICSKDLAAHEQPARSICSKDLGAHSDKCYAYTQRIFFNLIKSN